MLLDMFFHFSLTHASVMTGFTIKSKTVLVFQFMFVLTLVSGISSCTHSALPTKIRVFLLDVTSYKKLGLPPDLTTFDQALEKSFFFS